MLLGFSTEVCPLNLSDAFDRTVALLLPLPPFSLHPSLQVKLPEQWKINSQVETIGGGFKAIRVGTAGK